MSHQGTDDPSELGDLEPGTRQREQLRSRIQNIALTALAVVLLLWGIWSAVDLIRGESGWAYCAVAWVLLAVALYVRLLSARRRNRLDETP
ncbi:hypothetical protein [Streptomyces sp. RKAG290]|uniref:hypothetical protein n=1 Tax=Streptomyces sp. RKAG290 TaxID=2888348 RepID=UPI002033EE1F|nr:hypothetical protein [Streptomyces sp. RKAG290]MCM2410758.1 hypothetical protein [Streptomyces sp. RKAG290]